MLRVRQSLWRFATGALHVAKQNRFGGDEFGRHVGRVGGDFERNAGHAIAVTVQQGIDQDAARKLVKKIKETKIKVQASIQGDKVRVTGKKRDDLQSIISQLDNFGLKQPLQAENFRD